MTTSTIILPVGGMTRSFNVYLPSSYNAKIALPLLIGLHGGGSSAKRFGNL